MRESLPDSESLESNGLSPVADPPEQKPSQFVELANKIPKLPVYLSTFLFLGALAIPAILVHRRLSRLEKGFLCVAGVLQTLFCIAALVLFVLWIVVLLTRAWNGDLDPTNPYGF